MLRINLAGAWELSVDSKSAIRAVLPGSNYLALMEEGMEDPFYGTNEITAAEAGHHDHHFTRTFELPADVLQFEHLDFVGDGIDTIARILINGQEAGKTNNQHRIWRFDIRSLVREGENKIELAFRDPYAYMQEEQRKDPHLTKPGKAKAFIRKTPCHYGWDWGPKLTPTGVIRSIALEAYDNRIRETRVKQTHQDGKVTLSLEMRPDHIKENLSAEVFLDRKRSESDPAGDCRAYKTTLSVEGDRFVGEIVVEDPRLWWPNGLGEQPLYDLCFLLKEGDVLQDEEHKQIGLRTLVLDTGKDQYGEQFRFVVNGVPVFVKGADWIPSDSFVTRTTKEELAFYVKATADAGMNMFRVWGGGMYESEDFYDLCDKYGILVWQDFIFACEFYPFWNEAFTENVHREVEDNVRRLRHRASLALWCGNNEIDALYPIARDKTVLHANKDFFYLTLRDWVKELDGVTAYWPGSPSSGHIDKGPQNFRKGKVSGDSHLWNVWHGMLPIEAFRDYPTRFCSEFGMESMPAMKTIRRINPNEEPDLFDEVMLLHQKSGGGNSKILYYLLQKYRNPAKFEDFVYLSQIVQSNAMRFATETWKRHIGQQNGAIIWQMNDCWPVASWAIIDYYKQYKATLYHAKHFNKMQMISNDYYKDRSELYVVNEKPQALDAVLEVEIADFRGKVIRKETHPVHVNAVSSEKICVIHYKGLGIRNLYIRTRLTAGEKELDRKVYLPVPDKDAALPKAKIRKRVEIEDGIARVTLESDTLARYVFLDSELTWANWSDNYLDLLPGEAVTVQVPIRSFEDQMAARDQTETNVSAEAFEASLKVRSLTDVEPAGSAKDDKKTLKVMWKKDQNWATYYAYKLVMLILWWESIGD